ncbi:PAS domain S-box protein [Methylobacterium nonmethylotrophicum]|uniref:Blue-light-activated histidine kinase n=2 Tax=Methylobacterium nonmethylotrophicum TaxID=1141884 RepID=A0A4Z0NRV3_9HYPH|nr:PAS domain S-box protein [Methylobacterium nonmethylotrophicum]
MDYVSPAIGTIYGIEPDALLGSVEKWAALIVPDDRDIALANIEKARSGEAVIHEFRIQRPADGAFRWIRTTDFPLRDNGNIPRIGGIADDVTEAKLAAEHSAILLAELQHRVRNIMALLRSITNRTAEHADSVSEYRELMMGRLLAFARVQALLTRGANARVGIATIVHDEVSVQAQHKGQYILDGPDIELSPKAAEVLTLAIHELATNAVKYGALSVPTGTVTVEWSTFEKRGGPWLAFNWTEEGAPSRPAPDPDAPHRRGFGSELIEARIPYELRGRGQVTIEPGGARCHLEFPLQDGASILETDAPPRATVFGGAIDMTGEPDLTGCRVLVVEDDYYLATDTARALRGAGAEVMGPCATEEDARVELAEQRPDAVVVDINLGPGLSFKLAETFKDRGIPFVFTTGYDAEVIPAEFEGVERLEKPLQLRQIVGAVAKLTKAA